MLLFRLLATLGTLLAVLFLSGCATVDRGLMEVSDAISSRDPVTGAREITLMSERAEIQRAQQAHQQIMQQVRQKNLRYDNQLPEYGRVQNIFQRLKRVVHRKNLPWSAHLIGQNTWNAFTTGGGKVYLYTGLMNGNAAIRSDDELAVVLAHEMAHITARHIGEREGKALLTQLADKKTRSSLYQASWSTNQEYEADRYSVIYMALAGYDPMAAVNVWERMARARGSYSADMLHTHPLNADRARSLREYATKARQYYIPGRINPQADQILLCNNVYCNRGGPQAPAGTGAGAAALLETVANAYMETEQAKAEARNREQMKKQQVQQAAQRLRLSNVRLTRNNFGKPAASGVAENLSNQPIRSGVVRVQYLRQGKIVHQHSSKWPGMKARGRQPFNLPLKEGQYDSVRLIPEFVQ